MKRLILLLLFLLLPALTGPASRPTANLIVPGERIGPWSLGITVPQLRRLFGPSSPSCRGWEVDQIGALGEYCPAEVYIFHRGNRPVHIRVGQITPFSHTAEGIGIGSSLATVLATYGRPTGTSRIGDDFGGYRRLVYDGMGLALRVNLVTETVVAISVFKPGTARSIWQF